MPKAVTRYNHPRRDVSENIASVRWLLAMWITHDHADVLHDWKVAASHQQWAYVTISEINVAISEYT